MLIVSASRAREGAVEPGLLAGQVLDDLAPSSSETRVWGSKVFGEDGFRTSTAVSPYQRQASTASCFETPEGTGDREVGEAGFHFYRARFYQPSIGRFLEQDPARLLAGLNFYAYVRSSPTYSVDPFGLWDWVRDFLEPVANFSAGFGDSLLFNIPRYARQGLGIDGAIDRCGDAYRAGVLAEIGTELALTAGSGALKIAVKSKGTTLARKEANKVLRRIARNGGFQHHKNPLAGHPGGSRALFPTGGLQPWEHSGPWNVGGVAHGAHMEAHRSMRTAESVGRTLVNPGTTATRILNLAVGDCECGDIE